MADDLYQKLLKLRDASFDLSSKSRLLHVAPRAKYQTPLLTEDGIPFFEKWARKPVSLPLSLFAPVTPQFTAESQNALFADFRYAFRCMEEGTGEQNIFLAIGFLRSQSTAPLLLVPLQIDPKTLEVSLTKSAPIENVPLRIKNRGVVELPSAHDFWNGNSFDIRNYFAAVDEATKTVSGWKTTSRGMFIGFYDKASLYAYEDTEAKSWKQGEPSQTPLLSQLLSEEGIHVSDSLLDELHPDERFNPVDHYFIHTLDSEASTALLEALSSENNIYAVEAPPGSAKEEFLANFISESVSKGKKVLLTYKKKASIVRFEKFWNPLHVEYKDITLDKAREALAGSRKILTDYNRAANMPIPPGNSTLSESLKILAETGTRKKIWPDSTFAGTEALDRESIHLAKSLLQDLLETLEFDDSKKALQAYRGVSLDSTNELQQKNLAQKLERAKAEFQTLVTLADCVSKALFFDQAIHISELADISKAITSDFNESTPSFDGWILDSKDWTTFEEALRALPNAGATWSEFRRNGSPVFIDEAIDMQLGAAREVLKNNQDRTFKAFSEYYHSARKTLLRTLKNPKQGKKDADLLTLTDQLIRLQDCKKLYMNTSALAGHLFGKTWQFEHTNWIVLAAKLQWFYDFRKKAEKTDHASLSYAILSKYSQLKDQIRNADELRELCKSAEENFKDLCEEFGFDASIDCDTVDEQAALIARWESSLSLLPLYTQIQHKRNELKKMGLSALEAAVVENHPHQDQLISELSRYWSSLQIQRACKIFPAIFSSTPKIHSKHSRDFREATDDLCTMNLRYAKDALQKNPKLLTILPIGQTAEALPQEHALFDVAVILDAETIPPLQAMPALLRSKRVVLFGDSNLPTPQCPIIQGEDRHPGFVAPQLESILAYSLYKGAKLSFLSLNILHKHPLLIDYANKNFYGKKIRKLPPPNTIARDLHIHYEKDLSQAIADAAAKHVEQHPMQSLGIIVFTEERRLSVFQAILKKIHEHPDLGFFVSPKDVLRDPYVRLPEEASGDYRDTLFICAEPNTTIASQGFNTKLINVCATHALSSLRIFASEKTEATSSPNAGVRAYVDFLKYIEAFKDADIFEKNPIQTHLCEQIFKEINTEDVEIETGWGYNGASVQFAIRDANNPEHFLLGIESDSGNDFLRASVEDRHYLRPKILERLGWKIIPLWCPNWYRSTEDERGHVLTTIAVEQSVAPPPREKDIDTADTPEFHVEPYQILQPKIEGTVHDVPIPELASKLLVLQMKFYIDAESPIHEKSLIRRILHLHGVHRAGPAVVRAIKDAIAQGLAKKAFIKTGSFFYTVTGKPVVLRNRSALPEEERKLIFISPEERALFPAGTDEQIIKQTLGLL